MTASEYFKWLRTADFVRGIAAVHEFAPPQAVEVAFAGRSNAGKSSVLNRLCDNRKLARTGRTPGRTRQINFFAPATPPPHRYLVDLPGYGYARMSQSQSMEDLLGEYLYERATLAGLVLIVDIRRGLGDTDDNLIHICRQRSVPLLALLNKADKITAGKAAAAVRQLANTGTQAVAFSALKGTGLAPLADWVGARLQPDLR